jgi:hypothetical protein
MNYTLKRTSILEVTNLKHYTNNQFYQKFSIFNPREKTAWDHLDVDIKEKIVNHFKTEIINGYVFNFNDNEYYINNKPYTYYEFNEKKRKISNL